MADHLIEAENAGEGVGVVLTDDVRLEIFKGQFFLGTPVTAMHLVECHSENYLPSVKPILNKLTTVLIGNNAQDICTVFLSSWA